jgi:thymidylate synthase (FAD)
MKWVEPEVYIVANTGIRSWTETDPGDDLGVGTVADYLDAVGAPTWNTDAKNESEALIEIGGRMCYRAFGTELNDNLTKVRRGNLQYIQNIVKQGHGSVLEHGSQTFIFRNVSRVFTHELVRHRVGCAISQESLRYVALDDIPFAQVSLNVSDGAGDMNREIVELVKHCERFITKWRGKLINENTSMLRKKEVTSWLRRLAPIGLATTIMWTTNLRTLRHVLALRTALGAEQEIRGVFDKVGYICIKQFPAVFADFTRSEDGVWKPLYEGV